MLSIVANNVNEALALGTMYLSDKNCRIIAPRDGKETVEYKEPVCTTYLNPEERVLFSRARDANPFFHLMESLWILAGRRDVKFLEKFNSNISSFSDDGVTFHAPYGFRLKHHHGIDQFKEVIDLLATEPDTRRAVISIWDPKVDLNKESRDIPCNDMIMFQIREGKLNMTVTCRSNDMIWGAYGANAVQFSMIQSFVAAATYADVGWYKQMSNSMHVYMDNPKWPLLQEEYRNNGVVDYYKLYGIKASPLCCVNADQWYKDLMVFMDQADSNKIDAEDFEEEFFYGVACPMFYAWHWRKYEKGDTQEIIDFIGRNVLAEDWRLAGMQWMERRLDGGRTISMENRRLDK